MDLVCKLLAQAGTPLAEQLQLCRSLERALLLDDGRPLRYTVNIGSASAAAAAIRRLSWLKEQNHQQLWHQTTRFLLQGSDAVMHAKLRHSIKSDSAAASPTAMEAATATTTLPAQRSVTLVLTAPPLKDQGATDAASAATITAMLLQLPHACVTQLHLQCAVQVRCTELASVAKWHNLRHVLISRVLTNVLALAGLKALPLLSHLTVDACDQLTSVVLPDNLLALTVRNNAQLRALDVSRSMRLRDLSCRENALTTLGLLSACSQLTSLDCAGNHLSSLADTRHLPELRYVAVEQQLAPAQQVALPDLAHLRLLSVGHTLPDLGRLCSLSELRLWHAPEPAVKELSNLASYLGISKLSLEGCRLPESVWSPPALPSLACLQLQSCQSAAGAVLDCSPAHSLTELVLKQLPGICTVLAGSSQHLRVVMCEDMQSLACVDLEACQLLQLVQLSNCPQVKRLEAHGHVSVKP
jgi:hypothetical protein